MIPTVTPDEVDLYLSQPESLPSRIAAQRERWERGRADRASESVQELVGYALIARDKREAMQNAKQALNEAKAVYDVAKAECDRVEDEYASAERRWKESV